MRLVSSSLAVALLLGPVVAVAAAPSPVLDSDSPLVSTFSVTSPTQVPGEKLKPGTYSIRVVDHLADRIILRIENASGKVRTTFLGLENSSLRGSGGTGTISWPGAQHGQNALRGYSFPGGGAVEFVYPKAEAVEIAKANSSKVPAIDPVSDGRLAGKNLSKDDMQMVTLWMLSSTRVGPGDASQPAIAAERYQAPTQVAQNVQPEAPQQADRAPQVTQASPATHVKPAAKVARQPAVSSLPHTASQFPLIFLAGLLSLIAAAVLRFRRAAADVA